MLHRIGMALSTTFMTTACSRLRVEPATPSPPVTSAELAANGYSTSLVSSNEMQRGSTEIDSSTRELART